MHKNYQSYLFYFGLNAALALVITTSLWLA
jgi:hypothetical protein